MDTSASVGEWTPHLLRFDNAKFFGKERDVSVIDMVVWHQTGDHLRFTNLMEYMNSGEDGPKSYHYHIDRTGVCRRTCHWKYKAYHAGESEWPVPPEGVRSGRSVNRRSIGVVFEGRLGEPRTDRQTVAGLWLYQQILDIPQLKISHNVGHKEVAPRRRADPSWDMDQWRRLLAKVTK